MFNAITHRGYKDRKLIGGLYGKREWEYRVEFNKATMLEKLKSWLKESSDSL